MVLVKAEKEGYEDGEAVISLQTPTVPDGCLEIVSVDPPLDFLAKALNASGQDLSKLAWMGVTVTLTVRYNKLGDGDMVINVTAPGDWSIKGECGKLRTVVSVPGSNGVAWRGSVRAPPGIGKNLSITVSGNLFDTGDWYRCNSGSPPPTLGSAGGRTTSSGISLDPALESASTHQEEIGSFSASGRISRGARERRSSRKRSLEASFKSATSI